MHELWLGSTKTAEVFNTYELKYSFDKEAYARSPFDDEPETDEVFGVSSDRMGLTVLEMVGDTPVIKVHGSLTPTFSRYHAWFSGMITSYEAIKDALQIVRESGQESVMMDFASGGGAVRGLDTVTLMMSILQREGIRIDGHTESHAFSAAYWIMSGCDSVTASRMAEVGSIGTLAVVATYANPEENMGVKFTVFKAGKYKALGNPYEELSDQDKAYLQANIDETNAFFLNHVSANRGVDLEMTDSWAEGKTFFAGKAIKNGLIDRISTLDDLIGSGASAQTTSDKRSFEMKISPEKLAQIEAGAAPESVLTKAELKQYNSDIEALAEADAAEETARVAAEAAAEELRIAAEQEEADKVANANKPAGSELHVALKENGKLEAKVETLTERLTKAEADLTAARADTQALLVLGQAAVEKLQVATRSPKESKGTVAEVLGQFNDLQAKMAKMFKTGQQTVETPVADTTKGAPLASGLRSKVAQLNANKTSR